MIRGLIPQDQEAVKLFYLLVIAAFLVVNIIFDVVSKDTPAFTVENLRSKVVVSYDASTLASSALVLMSVFDANLATVLGEFWIPLMLAGISGVLVSFPGMFPKS